MLTESLALRQAQFGNFNPVTADSLLSLATLRIAQNHSGQAVPLALDGCGKPRKLDPWLWKLCRSGRI